MSYLYEVRVYNANGKFREGTFPREDEAMRYFDFFASCINSKSKVTLRKIEFDDDNELCDKTLIKEVKGE